MILNGRVKTIDARRR